MYTGDPKRAKHTFSETTMAAPPDFVVLGQSLPRVGGADKVRGRTRYTADVHLPGTLWARNVRSPHAHARIVAIDTSRAMRVPGVRAVITAADLPDRLTGRAVRDYPILCRDRARFIGDKVAAVAADDSEAAEEGALLVQVEYEVLPAVLDPLAADAPDAAIIHPDPYQYGGFPQYIPNAWRNVCGFKSWEHGDVDAGFAAADRVLEHTFTTQLSHQGYLEPHACLVSAETAPGTAEYEGRIEVWATAKTPFALRRELARVADRPETDVVIHTTTTGADFGSKVAPEDVPIAYVLSRITGRPVKMVMPASEDLTATHPRSPAVITLRTAVSRDGRILAREARVVYDSGAYAAFRPASNDGMLPGARVAAGAYHIPAMRTDARMVYTNQVPCGYMRAPGQPQMIFAVEAHMDLIARELGLDPLDFRVRNAGGAAEHGGPSVVPQLLQTAADAVGWSQPRLPFVGRGIAAAERDVGAGQGTGDVTLNPDGTITVVTATPDNGTGAVTVAGAMAAECWGIPLEQVHIRRGDTDDLPYDAEGGGSRLTNVIGANVIAACNQLKEQLMPLAAKMLGSSAVVWVSGGVRSAEGRFASLAEFASEMLQPGDPVAHVQVSLKVDRPAEMCFGVEAAEVEVDPETGHVRLRRLAAAHTVGTIVNAIAHQGQIEGAIVQGVGYSLMEELPRDDGRITATHLGEYKMPTVRDLPELTTVNVRVRGGGPFDASAIGETPIVPTAGAIANAVADAIGAPVMSLPITAETVLRLIDSGRKEAAP
jgi:CO/xanthine dehydrogenase Mo-binding subunit